MNDIGLIFDGYLTNGQANISKLGREDITSEDVVDWYNKAEVNARQSAKNIEQFKLH